MYNYTHNVLILFLGNNMFYIFAYIIDILIKAGFNWIVTWNYADSILK